MKRLTIKKLIVISQSESRSLEVPFEDGLNRKVFHYQKYIYYFRM